MLNKTAVFLIGASQAYTDSLIPILGRQYDNPYHFDNNMLLASTNKINDSYRAMLSKFMAKPTTAMDYFGRITHALQDFYSHSNWYELSLAGFTGGQHLLDEGYDFFQVLNPLGQIGKTQIVSLENGFSAPTTKWGRVDKWQVDPNTFVVSTTTSNRIKIGGLMTGEVNNLIYGKGNSVPIFDPVTGIEYKGFSHGGLAGVWSSQYISPLAKDSKKERYHKEVLELARDQVQHEFVRMLALIYKRHGDKGLQLFSDKFVKADKKDEFKDLINGHVFSKSSLITTSAQNTSVDNSGDHLLIQTFFDDKNPNVTPMPEENALPSSLSPYASQIDQGLFKWVPTTATRRKSAAAGASKAFSSTVPGAATSGPPQKSYSYELEILSGANWQKTGYFTNDINQFL